MRAFIVKQYSDNLQFLAIQKEPKFPHHVLPILSYFIKKNSLVLFKILCTLQLGYLLTRFCIIYLFESATFKSTKFIQKTLFLGSNAIFGRLFLVSVRAHEVLYVYCFQSTVVITFSDAHFIPSLVSGSPLSYPLYPSKMNTVVLMTSLLSGMTRYFRLILCISCPRPGTSHSSVEC